MRRSVEWTLGQLVLCWLSFFFCHFRPLQCAWLLILRRFWSLLQRVGEEALRECHGSCWIYTVDGSPRTSPIYLPPPLKACFWEVT